MSDNYIHLSVQALRKELILRTKEFSMRLETEEEWDSFDKVRNDIRKLIQLLDLALIKP